MINEFLQYLRYEKNYSSHTVLSYHTDLKAFCDFLNTKEENFKPDLVTSSQIQQWIISMMDAGITARSVSRKMSALKSFWRFLLQKKKTENNPTLKIVLPKTKKTLPTFFKQEEMESMLDDTYLPPDFEKVRDHLIVELFYATGIRLSELINICDADIDLRGKSLRVIGKRNKERVIPLGQQLCAHIQSYVELRNEAVEVFVDANLFVRINGKKLYPKLVYNMVRRVASEVSTLYKRSPHVLRHTFATAILNEGADIDAVKELLGHSSLAATQVYTHTSFEELNKIYKQAHPRASKKGGTL